MKVPEKARRSLLAHCLFSNEEYHTSSSLERQFITEFANKQRWFITFITDFPTGSLPLPDRSRTTYDIEQRAKGLTNAFSKKAEMLAYSIAIMSEGRMPTDLA
ncbi:MAG: hypothetical protein U0935_00920 [Pirellulales bacterium]